MAEPVVERLEAIHVHHQDPDRVRRAAASAEQLHVLLEIAPVRQPGQRIRGRLRLRMTERLNAGERGRGLAGTDVQDSARAVRPGARPASRDDDDAQDLLARNERDGERVRDSERAPHPSLHAGGHGGGRGGRVRLAAERCAHGSRIGGRFVGQERRPPSGAHGDADCLVTGR